MTALKLTLACFLGSHFAMTARAQAATEYAAKSAGAAASSAIDKVHFGVCPLDSAVVGCVHRYYPGPFYVAIVAICFVLWMLLYPKRKA